MRRIYIFLSTPISNPGGSQCYLAAKAKYLEEQGWDVHVFSPANFHQKCLIESLEKYRRESFAELSIPPFQLSTRKVQKKLSFMLKSIGPVDTEDEILIESHEDIYSFWGELLASRLKARHFVYLMNESYRKPSQFYEEKIDFFKYKFKRGEIMGNYDTISRLFDGYLTIKREDYAGDVVINESPIVDIRNPKVENIGRKDWNIAYLGRPEKPYVKNIIKEIGTFAKAHQDKQISFVVVSDFSKYSNIIQDILKDNQNLSFECLGYLHPIPTTLFSKIDVMIAGSGSARHSVEEGVLTIVADPEHCDSNGLLGYETMNSIMRDKDSVVSSFEEALERVLVKKCYLDQINKYPKKESVAETTAQNFRLFSKATPIREYYPETFLIKGRKDIRNVVKKYAIYYSPTFIFSIKNQIKGII